MLTAVIYERTRQSPHIGGMRKYSVPRNNEMNDYKLIKISDIINGSVIS